MTSPVYLGFDLGTTALKAILSDGQSRILAATQVGLTIERRKPQWSEQDPAQWWRALIKACQVLRDEKPKAWARLAGLSFSGQMHGVVLLCGHKVLRPCILWNDGRAVVEALELNELGGWSAMTAGVRAMAGFSAPKLKWLAKYEPAVLNKTTTVLCPKDYLRCRLTGELATDPVDASGMWLLDVAKGQWDQRLVSACGLKPSQLPPIKFGDALAGSVTTKAAHATGLPIGLPVAIGTGDAAANTLGLGLIAEGDGVVSLGTSAQIFVSKEQHLPKPDHNIHAFAHGLPRLWFQMAALLNGASPLQWCADRFFEGDVAKLLRGVEKRGATMGQVMFLPYLAGERTPYDAPHLRGGFFGLDHSTDKIDLARAVMEGVALSLADCAEVLAETGTKPKKLFAVGGGFRSKYWTQMIANALGQNLHIVKSGDYGGSLGAARLARRCVTGEEMRKIFVKPKTSTVVKPDAKLAAEFRARLPTFRAVVPSLFAG